MPEPSAVPDRTDAGVEYRLSWEMVSSTFAALTEERYGRQCWPDLDWSRFEWHRTVKITTNPWEPHNTLKQWARSKEQPIRNVRLEKRAVPLPDDGWEPVR